MDSKHQFFFFFVENRYPSLPYRSEREGDPSLKKKEVKLGVLLFPHEESRPKEFVSTLGPLGELRGRTHQKELKHSYNYSVTV